MNVFDFIVENYFYIGLAVAGIVWIRAVAIVFDHLGEYQKMVISEIDSVPEFDFKKLGESVVVGFLLIPFWGVFVPGAAIFAVLGLFSLSVVIIQEFVRFIINRIERRIINKNKGLVLTHKNDKIRKLATKDQR